MAAKRAVFMGSDTFSVPIFRALLVRGLALEEPVCVAGLVTQPDRPSGRGRRPSANAVKQLAADSGVPVLQPERVRAQQSVADIAKLAPDVIVVAAYGQILPAALLDIPPLHTLNLHPSLLPLHRGPSPVAGSILAGDTVTGTSVMLVTPRMDAGPVLRQLQTEIGQDETSGELEDLLSNLSGQLLLESLPGWIRGEIRAEPQDEALATYTTKISKEDGRLDWNLRAGDIVRRVRAYNPWPVAFSLWDDRSVRVHRAHAAPGAGDPGTVLEMRGGGLVVAAGKDAVAITELQLPGARRLPAVEVVRGQPGLLHARLV